VPRRPIDLGLKVEYLSILGETGQVDAALEPKLDADLLLRMYRVMLAARRLDERMVALQRQGRIGTYGPTRGQEGGQVGAALALRRDDWAVQAFRELGVCIARGWPMLRYIQFWGGYEEGNEVPPEVNDLPIAVPVATQTLHAAGVAWGMKLKKKQTAVMGFCGDGATSEGDFHEALNFAGVFDLPVVFFIQNNHWAISHPRARQTKSVTLAQKAIAYGLDGLQIDGNDVLAAYVAASDALTKARAGGGPSLIEAVTYRMDVHTTADDPRKYRKEEEVKEWAKRDPIERFVKYLRGKGVLDDKTVAEIEADVQSEVKAAVDQYDAARDADPMDMFRFVYADPPAELAAQRDELARCLAQESGEE